MIGENTKIFEQNKQKALDAISYFDIKEAREISKELEFQVKKMSETAGNDKEIEECSALLTRLKILTLPLLADEEVMRLIRMRAVEMLRDADLDLAERVETRLLTVPPLLRYEMVNQPIIEALHKNQETIGDERIFVSGNPEAQDPTVENWLLDYDRTFGTGPQKDLVWLEYVNSGANAARLETKEKEVLRKLLKFYEFLKPEYGEEGR
jgi:hypothetical protein